MNLSDYQDAAVDSAIYARDYAVTYPILGLVGEAGEVAEKWKKNLRDGVFDIDDMAKELGDVLWYLANTANDLGLNLDFIAWQNLDKLADRKARGVLAGNGDNR